MTSKDLANFKKQLAKLPPSEKQLRDEYLRGIAIGEIAGPSTGYPSIDKPALQYYNFEKYLEKKPKLTITEGLFRQNAGYQDDVAIEYFFSKITYGKLFENIFSLVKILSKRGISKGNSFCVCLAGIPESMYALYAAGYLGATSIFLPPYLDKQTMINDINKDHSKILIVMDLFYEKNKTVFDEVLEKSTLEEVVIVPTLNSSVLGKLKKSPVYKDSRFKTYNEFIWEGRKEEIPKIQKYEENMPVAVVYSSGTTGILKGVLLSHDSINNSALSYLAFGFDLKRGQKFYQAIPVWSSTGLVANGTSPLYYGSILHQNPKFDPLEFSKNIGLSRDNWGIGTTELFNGLDQIRKTKLLAFLLKLHILDYSKLTNAYIGGTLSTPKDKEKLNEIFAEIGSPAVANSSYGTCENGSIVTAELNHLPHYDYSVGIPIPGAIVIAIDKNEKELPYNTRGELAIKTNCGMLKYYNREDLNGVFFTDESEKEIFKHTGDIGYVMPNGFVIYEGRANDISLIDGTEIYNFDVKKVILEDPSVFDCEVFEIDGKLCAHIVFRNNDVASEKKYIELQTKIYERYQDNAYVPVLFKKRDSFPMANSTKRDYKKIKAEKEGFIYIPKNEYARKRKCDIL